MPESCSADTSPLVYLFRIGKLGLLHALFDRVLVAEAVTEELARGRVEGAKVPDPSDYRWITHAQPGVRDVPERLMNFGAGEREAILLALEGQAQWVILDDLEARQAADELGVRIIGTVGLLVLAKKRGLIDAVAPFLEELLAAGMWISRDLKQNVLDLAGER